MNQGTFTIKVSDILLHSGSRDIVVLQNIFSTKIPGLQKGGISGNILLENLNKSEILVTLDAIEIEITSICDRCGKDFFETRQIDAVSIQAKIENNSAVYEDLLDINPKDLTIDIEDFLKDQCLLHQPLKNLCTLCAKKSLDENDENEDFKTGIIRH